MSAFNMPSVMCDAVDGCDEYSEDYYAQGISRVTFYDGGPPRIYRPTATEPAPGWVRVDVSDFCPEHKSEATA